MNPRQILVLVLVLLVTGCQAAVSSPSPTATEVASQGASTSPSASSSIPPFPSVELPPQSRARLAVTMDTFDVPDEAKVATLEAGTEVIVIGGPRDVEQATWYQLQFPPEADSPQVAWVRIDAATALTPVDLPCPASADAMLGWLAWDRVRCFGTMQISIEGRVGHCQGGVVFAQPEWLAYACWQVSDDTGTMAIHAGPASGIIFPDDLVRARMTGHFDDPASTSCVYLGDPDPMWAPSASEQVYLCREAFVVDRFEVLEVIGPGLS